MRAVILAGGYGTRFTEETARKPKPMIEVGGRPLLWHIMKIYAHWGVTDFVVCLGHRGYVVKDYFANYVLHTSDVTLDLLTGEMTAHAQRGEPWRVTLVDTGLDTMTGGRIKRIAPYVGDETFLLTYGDGVGDVDVRALRALHRAHGKTVTLTAAQPPGRFGRLGLDGDVVRAFQEKPADGGWVNGGFFVVEPAALDVIDGDDTVWERGPLETLASRGELTAYRHDGFWACMDTPRDHARLEALWSSGEAPWKVWTE